MQPTQNRKLSGGWKTLIASLSVTSLVGLVNLFSNEDANTTNYQAIDTLLNNPVPTLVPAVEVRIPVPTAVPTAIPTVVQVAPPAYVPPTTVYLQEPQPAPAASAAQPAPAVKNSTPAKKPSAPKPSTSTSSS
jgi:hypothetical protein